MYGYGGYRLKGYILLAIVTSSWQRKSITVRICHSKQRLLIIESIGFGTCKTGHCLKLFMLRGVTVNDKDCNSNVPASKSEGVSLALHLPALLVHPLEVGEAGPVVELDVVQDCAAVAGLRHVGEVAEELGHVGEGADRAASQHQVEDGHRHGGHDGGVRRLHDHEQGHGLLFGQLHDWTFI